MPFNIQGPELILILVIALVVLGPGKLPEVGSALGKSIREFRKAATDVKEATSIEPVKPPAPNVPAVPVQVNTLSDTPAPSPAPPADPSPPPSGAFEDRPAVGATTRPSDPDAPAS